MKPSILIVIFIASLFVSAAAQDRLEWSATKRLTVNDFKGPAPDPTTHQSLILNFAANISLKPEEAMDLKTFNDRVSNAFMADQSWIDWRDESRLRYAITLFDLGEWRARETRKRLGENRDLILAGKQDVLTQEVNDEFHKVHEQYNNETNYGNYAEGQLRWEMRINERLAALGEYCKTCK